MLQNVLVAGFARSSRGHGIPLSRQAVTLGASDATGGRPKVMTVLYKIAKRDSSQGRAIRPEFFPDIALSPLEKTFWNTLEETDDDVAAKDATIHEINKITVKPLKGDAKRTYEALSAVWT